MATWDITVPSGSGVGEGGTGSSAITEPGDFDGATITDVSIVGTPTVTSDGTTDDTIGIRWNIETSTGTDIWGGVGSDAASACYASIGDSASSANITDGSAPSPAPGTAVAADWDQVAYAANYSANMKNDGETVSWSAFTLRVTYTPNADVEITTNAPQALTLTEQTATLTHDVAITASSQALTLTENTASIGFDVNITTTAQALTLTAQTATVAYDAGITTTPQALTLTEQAATVTHDVAITSTPQALAITTNQATVGLDINITAAAQALALTENQQTITHNVDISASVDTLGITTYQSSVAVSVTTDGIAKGIKTSRKSIVSRRSAPFR